MYLFNYFQFSNSVQVLAAVRLGSWMQDGRDTTLHRGGHSRSRAEIKYNGPRNAIHRDNTYFTHLKPPIMNRKKGFFFVFQKWLRAQRAGRVAPRRGGAKRRAAALGAAQRPKAPPQAAERRAAHEACFSAFNFAPIIDREKKLTGKSVGN